jgi:polyphosphate kinase
VSRRSPISASASSRELSWLEFNRRVLHEALDERTSLLEALKFLAIFSTNLDEYFMVRVAALKQQIEAQVTLLSPDGLSPEEHLQAISATLRPMVEQQHRAFATDLRQQMAQRGIWLIDYGDLSAAQQTYCRDYFEEQIFPVLTPLAVDPGHPFPYISNLSLNLAVVVRDPHTEQIHFAPVKVPRVLPRFIPLPEPQGKSSGDRPKNLGYHPCRWLGVPLEQVIAANLSALFPGMVVQEHYDFRITRNTDLAIEEDEADDLMLAIEQELRKRRRGGSAVRLEMQRATPWPVRAMLIEELGLAETDICDNIRVVSIVGQFLEHSRVLYFQNGGQEIFLLGSADWMPRNLDRRVEVMVPIAAPPLRQELKTILELCLTDNRQAWDMAADGSYRQRCPQPGEPSRSSQALLMERASRPLGKRAAPAPQQQA